MLPCRLDIASDLLFPMFSLPALFPIRALRACRYAAANHSALPRLFPRSSLLPLATTHPIYSPGHLSPPICPSQVIFPSTAVRLTSPSPPA
ncbi:hypothetical protein NL676_011386 [Syzygium grande]|nr:hypothetical protein NL676_011386 [Syzygium grande]